MSQARFIVPSRRSAAAARVPSPADLLEAHLTRPRLGDRYLLMLALVLLGYALDGRGFAYLGIPPLFIGEITLLFGMFVLLATPRWARVFQVNEVLVLLPFILWGFLRTVPFVALYQVDALRDAVLWGYSLFAIYIAAVLLAEPARLDLLIRWYDRFTRIFLVTIPCVFIIVHFAQGAIPTWPWAGKMTIIQIKEGDAMVHMAGIIAFWASGLGRPVHWRWVALMAVNLALMSVIDRGGMIAFLTVLTVCFLLRPRSLAPWRLISMIGVAVTVLAVSGISVEVPGGKGRPISFDQLVKGVFSLTNDTGSEGMDSTKEWRMDWWKDIVNYTFNGPYFWGGKGYGISLGEDDGYEVGDGTLRSPHNVHMTFLARGGVPGLMLWAVAQITWGFGIGWAYLTARRRSQARWTSLFLFVGCFWAAFLINASFDVYIEGPMGGIWFWTVWGVGIALLWMYRKERSETKRSQDSEFRIQGLPAFP